MDFERSPKPIDRRPPRAVLVRFAATLAGCSAAWAAALHWGSQHDAAARTVLATGLALAAAALLPGIGRRLYVAWMTLGVVIGRVTSPIFLGVCYFAVITPCALALKLLRRDVMQRRLQPKAATYWQPYDKHDDPARYLKPF